MINSSALHETGQQSCQNYTRTKSKIPFTYIGETHFIKTGKLKNYLQSTSLPAQPKPIIGRALLSNTTLPPPNQNQGL